MKFITKNFFRGILFLAPITLTVYIFYLVFRNVDQIGAAILSPWINKGTLLRGIGFLLTVALITLIGYLSSVWIGSIFFGWIESAFSRSPFINGIYNSIRDVFQSMLGQKKAFSQVVLVNFPALGYRRIGFVTQEQVDFLGNGGKDHVAIYLPTSYQIGGCLIIVDRKNIERLDMSPETALKMVISGGVVKNAQKTIQGGPDPLAPGN